MPNISALLAFDAHFRARCLDIADARRQRGIHRLFPAQVTASADDAGWVYRSASIPRHAATTSNTPHRYARCGAQAMAGERFSTIGHVALFSSHARKDEK